MHISVRSAFKRDPWHLLEPTGISFGIFYTLPEMHLSKPYYG